MEETGLKHIREMLALEAFCVENFVQHKFYVLLEHGKKLRVDPGAASQALEGLKI